MAERYTLAGSFLILVLLITGAAAQGSGSLTRGGTFTVTVIGVPRTAYVIWVSGTHAMTGEPGDQPPVIVAGQVDVQQDPPGGPYAVGSLPIGGGRTVLDDVAPSSSVVPATNYYARVTTDAGGRGAVLFQTSQDTAIQEFHIVAENPDRPGEDVSVVLGLPEQVPIPKTPATTPTVIPPLLLPATTPTEPVTFTTVPSTPAGTPVPPPETTIPEIPRQEMPVRKIPFPPVIAIAAAGIGLLLRSRDAGA